MYGIVTNKYITNMYGIFTSKYITNMYGIFTSKYITNMYGIFTSKYITVYEASKKHNKNPDYFDFIQTSKLIP